MKKYITAAAFFAAGTMLANAAVTVWTETPTSASGTDVASWDVSSAGLSWSSGVTESVVFTIDAASISSESGYALFSMSSLNGTIRYTGLTSVCITGGNITLVGWTNSTSAQTATVALSSFSATKDLTFVVSRSSDQSTLTVYADGNFDASGTTLTGTSGFFGNHTWTTLDFGGTSYSYTGNVANAMPANSAAAAFTLLGAGYTVGSVVSTDELKAYYSAIPEPSAFGLLAGAGALALVAARRRRAK